MEKVAAPPALLGTADGSSWKSMDPVAAGHCRMSTTSRAAAPSLAPRHHHLGLSEAHARPQHPPQVLMQAPCPLQSAPRGAGQVLAECSVNFVEETIRDDKQVAMVQDVVRRIVVVDGMEDVILIPQC